MVHTQLFREHAGESPVLINIPHAGTDLPSDMAGRLSKPARSLPDTDWYVDQLYDFARGQGASLLAATQSRYVIDLNRPPDNAALYASGGSGLVPEQTFDQVPIYQPGEGPSPEEQQARLQHYWQPYHDHLQQRLDALRSRHGYVVLLDAHSIRSKVPALFDGQLPELNLGSYDGAAADTGLIERAAEALAGPDYSLVTDARFKGGYITRHYGQPDQGQHALQLEIAQRAYMTESPPAWKQERAEPLQRRLGVLVEALLSWRPSE